MATLNGRLVEQLGQLLLVEVLVDLALAQRHLGDRAHARARAGCGCSASGAITPRRAAWARSKREVWVGKRSATWRAIRAPVAVMPMKTGPGPGADAGAGLLAERGVGLVADHDRVGVGDAAGVADEPLVGLDRDRAVRVVGAVEQRRREPLAVAAVGDLADELVDEVAAVGEDQDAAGARGLDEADRGDRLAGAGGVLEPEAAVGARVLGRLVDDVLVLLVLVPVLGLLVGLEGVVLVVGRLGSPVGRRRRSRLAPLPDPLPLAPEPFALPFCSSSAISAASVPESASTWCSFSSAPSARWDVSSASRRSSPSISEKLRRHSIEGASRPSSISASAASSARRRACPGTRSLGFSPSSRKGSRANSRARSISAAVGAFAAFAATLVVSAMRLSDLALPAQRRNRARGDTA